MNIIKCFLVVLCGLFAISAQASNCHPGVLGICSDAPANTGFAWYRVAADTVACFAIEAPAGSSADDQRNCSPHGFAWYLAADGNNYCYSIDAPSDTSAVSHRHCK